MKPTAEKGEATNLADASRRQAVKTIVGGVAGIAAYNLLPARWGTPIVESIFLPAHAATSGNPANGSPGVVLSCGDPGYLVPVTVTGLTASVSVHPLVSGGWDGSASLLIDNLTSSSLSLNYTVFLCAGGSSSGVQGLGANETDNVIAGSVLYPLLTSITIDVQLA